MSSFMPIELVAGAGNLDMLKTLIEEQNYDPKKKGEKRRTLLHYACIGGHLDIVKYLICEHQLDPLSEDDSYETPLHLACEHGHLSGG